MTDFLSFLVTCFTDFFGKLDSMIVVPGVSLLAIIIAVFLIGLVLNNFLMRAK